MHHSRIGVSTYPAPLSCIDWLSNTFEALDGSAFRFWRGCYRLVNIVNQVEDGTARREIANSAIQQHNEDHGTNLSYEEVRDLCSDHVFSPERDYLIFTNNISALCSSEYGDAEQAVYEADERVEFAAIWIPSTNEITVYRSLHTDYKHQKQEGCIETDGTKKGDLLSFSLPPEIEATIIQDFYYPMENNYDNSYGRSQRS
tara:strand:+ start:561 stop:1163 length:603 start_codon:yes stop_codon:yes gene_type:complete